MIALHLVAIVLAQDCHLIVRLDPLGDDPQIELLAGRDHGGGDGLIVTVTRHDAWRLGA